VALRPLRDTPVSLFVAIFFLSFAALLFQFVQTRLFSAMLDYHLTFLVVSGALLGVTLRHGALSVGGLHLFAAADWLAPGLPDSSAIAVATSFAFLQSVHYAIWLVAIPAGDRPGEGGRSWRVAFRDLIRDLTPAGVFAVAVLAIVVAGLGLVHAAATRRLVLSLATFHVWLELAVLAYFFARGAAGPSAAHAGGPSPSP